MNPRLALGPRLLASAIAIALALVAPVTCLAAVMQMPETSHHASCHGMKKDGASVGSIAAKKDCCAIPNAEVARFTSTDQVLTPPASALSTPFVFEPLPVQDCGAALDPGVPKPSSSPTYLLVSSFRI